LSYLSFKIEDTAGVIRYSRDAVKFDPGDAMAHNNLGYGLILNGDLKAAAKSIDRALAIDADHVLATNNKALLHIKSGQYLIASQLIDKVIKLDPTVPEVYLNRGYLLYEQGDLES